MLKKAMVYILLIAVILVVFACKNKSDSEDDNNKLDGVKFQEIQIDGMCYDWVNIEPVVTGQDAIKSIQVAHDQDYLYFCISGSNMGPHFDLFIDADSDMATGYRSPLWTSTGCDYLLENGFLYKSKNSAWNWDERGTDGIIYAANSDIVEIRIQKKLLPDLAEKFKVGFWDVNSLWKTETVLPASGTLPAYDLTAGYDISVPAIVPKVLIPAYFDPGSNWDRIADKAKQMPGRIFVIANPSNGPGGQLNTRYKNAIEHVRENNGRVLGYIYSLYGKRDLDVVKDDIDAWFEYYTIDGIFVDEQAYTTGSESFYKSIHDYIKSIKPSALVVGNPGIQTIESYLFMNSKPVTDVICIYEDKPDTSWTPPEWTSRYASAHFCSLALNAGTDYRVLVDKAVSNNIGWVYSTDDVLPNPWDTLPDYFEEFCDYLLDK